MAKTNNTKAAVETKETKKGANNMKKQIEKKVNAKKETKPAVVEKKEVAKPAPKTEPKAKVEKKEAPKAKGVPQLKNSELAQLFVQNGCVTRTKASDESNVVYQTFGTKSRVLQQNRAYQLLLTNGHEMKKGLLVDAENDDTARFIEWYNTLTDEQKAYVAGFDTITATKLATTEMPRERTVKIINYDLLVEYIKYMATFTENQPATAAK